MRRSKPGIILGVSLFLGLLLIPLTEDGEHICLFYLVFSILWATCTFLSWHGFRFLRYVILAAFTIPGVVALVSYSSNHNRIALLSGTISMGVLLSLMIITVMVVALFLGPGLLAGLWIYYVLGSTIWSGSLGVMMGLGIFLLTSYLLRMIVIPYSHGFGTTMLGGIVAYDLSNTVFHINSSYLVNRGVENFFDQIGQLNFESLRNTVGSAYFFFSWVLGGFGIKNWIIVAVALGVGVLFVLKNTFILSAPNSWRLMRSNLDRGIGRPALPNQTASDRL